jgi:hypothetical protein
MLQFLHKMTKAEASEGWCRSCAQPPTLDGKQLGLKVPPLVVYALRHSQAAEHALYSTP